jgi:hypothetical protein
MAVGRTILQMAFHMIRRGETYHDPGPAYLDCLDRERTVRRLVNRLQTLGLEVQVKDQVTAATAMNGHDPTPPPLPLAV